MDDRKFPLPRRLKITEVGQRVGDRKIDRLAGV